MTLPRDLILDWLLEWHDKDNTNRSKTYKMAHSNLQAHPAHKLRTVDDLRAIKYIGPKIQDMIRTRLQERGLETAVPEGEG